jgi:carbon-monoxide dehydrogenase large subunit
MMMGPFVGRGMKRTEDPRLLAGRGRYVADITRPRQLEMAVLRSPHPHARLLAIDTAAAARCAGVHAVITYRDVAAEVGTLPAIDVLPDAKPVFHTVLADGVVRYVGEPIAVVVADDRYVAEDALELIAVSYEPLPVVTDIVAASAGDAPLLYPAVGTNVVQTFAQATGDVDAAMASAFRIYRETYTIHRYAAVPMETRGVVADCDPATGELTLWTSTQFPHKVRDAVAGVLGLPAERLRVVAPDVGGGFGVKECVYPEEVLAPLLAARLGRPIRWIEDRAEHLVAAAHGREQRHELVAAVDADGVITALDATCATNIGAAFATVGNAPGFYVSAMLRGPYRIPHYRSAIRSVVTNKTPLNVYRGAGHPQAVLCMERLLDTIARDLDIDRVELRLRNMLTAAEMPSDRGVTLGVQRTPVIYDSGDYPRSLRDAAALLDYAGFRARQTAARAEGRYLGIGLSFYVEGTAFGPFEYAQLRAEPSGRVTLTTGSSPHGQGTATTHAQLVADELAIAVDAVDVVHGDTKRVKEGIGTWGSRSGAIGGTAARLAAVQLKESARAIAAARLSVDPGALAWTAGRIHLRTDPSRGFSLGELAGAPLVVELRFDVPGIAYSYAAHIAIVEVDIGTGRVFVRRYGVAHDCGRVINPAIVEAQVVGGVVQGIGATLLEELPYDAGGEPLARSMMDYLLPSAADIPIFSLSHTETPTPHNPYGIKGAGEGGTTGAPAALVNALEDALAPFGVRLNDDGPFTPSRVLELLGRR